MYSVLITFSFSSIIQSAFIIYLWSRLYTDTPLIKYEVPTAYATAPELK
mgnify:CR=1